MRSIGLAILVSLLHASTARADWWVVQESAPEYCQLRWAPPGAPPTTSGTVLFPAVSKDPDETQRLAAQSWMCEQHRQSFCASQAGQVRKTCRKIDTPDQCPLTPKC
jgi:hypothetical protein